MSGQMLRPKCSKSSPVLAIIVSVPSGSARLSPNANFAPPTPPDSATTPLQIIVTLGCLDGRHLGGAHAILARTACDRYCSHRAAVCAGPREVAGQTAARIYRQLHEDVPERRCEQHRRV